MTSPASHDLTARERQVLEAVIQSYVETAEPAASRTLSRRFGLGVSPATIRNTMSDLEEKGYLFHPHTSAGRVPTDRAYRLYVDSLLAFEPVVSDAERRMADELAAAGRNAIEGILRRAAQSLGVLTQELGVAVGPRLDAAVLRRIELVKLASDRMLMVLALERGVARSIYIEVPVDIADDALGIVSAVLNERLAGHTLAEIRSSLGTRLRDASAAGSAGELLNIFLEEGEQYFADAMRADAANEAAARHHRDPAPPRRRPPRPQGQPRHHHHDRQRARRSAPRALHHRDRRVPRRRARGGDRRHRPDADALRQGHLARHPHLAAGQRPALRAPRVPRAVPSRLTRAPRHRPTRAR
ncbi:MAG: heat-inducible transcriptional repressor HrcA [Gemmatimonadaceae bacterium]|nr:heat-inducible transcriptional repressor HrcA [Gemmatimonadaceae bacterium]